MSIEHKLEVAHHEACQAVSEIGDMLTKRSLNHEKSVRAISCLELALNNMRQVIAPTGNSK